MKFGTSIDMLSMGEPAPSDKAANNVDTFALSSEELAYVNSLDAQRYANKEALETVLQAAQDNYQRQLSRITTMRDTFISQLVAKHKISQGLADYAMIVNGFFVISKNKDKLIDHIVPTSAIAQDILSAVEKKGELVPDSADYALNLLLEKCGIMDNQETANLLGYVLGIKELTAPVKNKLETGGCMNIFKGIHEFSSFVNSKSEEGKALLNSGYDEKDGELIKIFILANFKMSGGQSDMSDSLLLMRTVLLALVNKYTSNK
jgi:hypothetical protein